MLYKTTPTINRMISIIRYKRENNNIVLSSFKGKMSNGKRIRITNHLVKIINGTLVDLPSPVNFSM